MAATCSPGCGGADRWETWLKPGDDADVEVVGGKLHAPTRRASDWWTVNASQTFGTLEAGCEYRLSFKARKEGSGSVLRLGFSTTGRVSFPIKVGGIYVAVSDDGIHWSEPISFAIGP